MFPVVCEHRITVITCFVSDLSYIVNVFLVYYVTVTEYYISVCGSRCYAVLFGDILIGTKSGRVSYSSIRNRYLELMQGL